MHRQVLYLIAIFFCLFDLRIDLTAIVLSENTINMLLFVASIFLKSEINICTLIKMSQSCMYESDQKENQNDNVVSKV